MFGRGTSWVSLRDHIAALREADQRALQIKETADAEALRLAREIQVYKDEKANELRSQIERERGGYATKEEMQPVIKYIAAQTSRVSANAYWMTTLIAAAAVAAYLIGRFA